MQSNSLQCTSSELKKRRLETGELGGGVPESPKPDPCISVIWEAMDRRHRIPVISPDISPPLHSPRSHYSCLKIASICLLQVIEAAIALRLCKVSIEGQTRQSDNIRRRQLFETKCGIGRRVREEPEVVMEERRSGSESEDGRWSEDEIERGRTGKRSIVFKFASTSSFAEDRNCQMECQKSSSKT